MRFADEVVDGDEIELAKLSKGPAKKEVEMAGRLVGSLEESFSPGRYKDRYRKAVLDMIERKAAGRKPKRPREKPPEETPDLMAALEASLGGGKQ